MKSFCKSTLLVLMFGVMTMLPIGKASAQSLPEPAVVISVAKFKEQMSDVNYLLTASGFAQMKFMAGAMVKGYTKGIDEGKDAGVLLYFNEGSEVPDFLGFVPVTDIEEMLDVVAQFAEVEENDGLTTIIADSGVELMIKEQDGFAFMSNNKSMFDELPDNPIQLLGKLPENYNLSAKIFAQRVPEEMRNGLIELIRQSSEDTFDSFGDDLQTEVQQKNLEMQMKQMEMLLNDADSLTIGMRADQNKKTMVMDVEFTGLPNSELAVRMAQSTPDKGSRFSGFVMEGSTFSTVMCAAMVKEDAEQYSTMLNDLKNTVITEMDQDGDMSDQEIATIKKSMNSLVDVVNQTMSEGLLDMGAVIMLEDGEMNFAGGIQVSNPAKLESTVKDLVGMIEGKMGDEIEVNLNSGSHKNITLHEIVIQVPEGEDEMRDALGDQLTLIIGVGKKEVYLAGGSNPVELLKKAVDSTSVDNKTVDELMESNSDKTEKVLSMYSLNISPILAFAAKMEGDPSVEMMAEALQKAGNDRMSMTSSLVENGFKMQFQMQDGILGLIKVGFDAFQGGGGFPTDDF